MSATGILRVAFPTFVLAALAGCQSAHGGSAPSDTEMKAFEDQDGAPAPAAGATAALTDDLADVPPDTGAEAAALAPAPEAAEAAAMVQAAPDAPAPAAPQAAEKAAADDGRKVGLGQLDDDDLRQVIYEGFKARLGKTAALGGSDTAATEIGDYDSFKFTVVKLQKGHEDVSGSGPDAPDGMDVEVTGWYKRVTLAQDGDAKPACTSFDALVTLTRQGGEWRVKDEGGPSFGREDSEDCF